MRGLLLFAFCLIQAQAQQAGRRPFVLEELSVPAGFRVSLFARMTAAPRHMTIGPNGVLYVTGYSNGTVVAIPEADRIVTVLRGLSGPHSIAFREGTLYVAVANGVLRYRDAVTDDYLIRSQAERVLSLPTGGHSTRTLGFGPDGGLYVSVGSSCNFCIEADNRRAAMLRFNEDGTGQTVFAKGLRNSVGFAWHPVTGEFWSADNGGDSLGDNEPPEEVNILTEGGDYGWPDCVGAQRPARWGLQARPDRCGETKPPELEMQAHSAPLGLEFYTGDGFPLSYKNDAFLSFHGSWNRSTPTGYKVVRIRAAGGRAAGLEDFLTGFLNTERRSTSGRPVHIVTAPDGAIFISDDAALNVYRVEYVGPRINQGGVTYNEETGVWSIKGRRLMGDTPPQVLANDTAVEVVNASAEQIDFVLGDLHGDVTITVQTEVAADSAVVGVP
ncbi:MAG: PQQ-dependent sugar dehydrogenase [Acidobacteria bacterium]|nr:PQQ-dependent sugar dehydrogenase [Acidobacteriota bacterium]